MPSRLNRCLFLASTALSLSLITYSAQATPSPLPGLTNLDFTQQNAGGTAPKSTFTSFNPTGWYGGGTGYISIDAPIAGEDAASNGAGGTLTAYADPVGKVPGNYVQADGNPVYEDGINYQLSGLTAGTKYLLSFYQGASQQTGFTGTTTNQWIVTLEGIRVPRNLVGHMNFPNTYDRNAIDAAYAQLPALLAHLSAAPNPIPIVIPQ